VAFLLLALVACGSAHGEPMTVAKHTFEVRIDDDLGDAARRDAARELVKRTLTKTFGEMREDFPTVFARQMPRLERLEIHRAGADKLEVATILANPSARLTDGDVAHGLESDFFAAVDPRFEGRAPEQIAPAEGADWFDWARLRPVNGDLMTVDVVRFALGPLHSAASDPSVARHVKSWLVSRADDLSRRGVLMTAPPPPLVAARAAYVQWLNAAAATLDDGDRMDLALPLFRLPQGTLFPLPPAYGYAAPEPVNRWAWDGFDAFAFGAASIDKWLATNAANPVRSFVQSAASSVEGTKRLAQLIASHNDPRFRDTCLHALRDDQQRAAVMKELR